MKVKIPSIDLIFGGHIDQIEKNYMNDFFNSFEQDLRYLSLWSLYKEGFLYEKIPLFSDNIIFLTTPFIEMVKKNWKSIQKVFYEEVHNESSEILNFRGVVFDQYFGCLLEILDNEVSVSIFDKTTGVPMVVGEVYYNLDTSEIDNSYVLFLSKHKEFVEEVMIPYVYRLVFSVIFEKLIDSKDIIVVPPNGRGKTINDKYINENKKSIKVWDSRKFNSYVRLDGFTVTGHLRHQRTGKDRKEHKLIWIQEFQKHGYNRNKLKMNISG